MEIVIWAQLILFSTLVVFNMWEDFSGSEEPFPEASVSSEESI